jgi:hypothetical protein
LNVALANALVVRAESAGAEPVRATRAATARRRQAA